jgi:hypothetical protein
MTIESDTDADKSSDFTVSDPNTEAQTRANRLKEAVRRNGGATSVARHSGVPLSTLNHHLLGREMKISTAAAIANVCGVTIDWLAGIAPDSSSARPVPEPAQQGRIVDTLFATLDMVRLGTACEAAIKLFEHVGVEPPRIELGRIVALLYDTPSLTNVSPKQLLSPREISDADEE